MSLGGHTDGFCQRLVSKQLRVDFCHHELRCGDRNGIAHGKDGLYACFHQFAAKAGRFATLADLLRGLTGIENTYGNLFGQKQLR